MEVMLIDLFFMKSKRIIVFLLALFLSATLMAQNFIQTTDGKCYWTDDPVVENNEVRVSNGSRMLHIPFSDIARRAMLGVNQRTVSDLSGVAVNTLVAIERGEGNP